MAGAVPKPFKMLREAVVLKVSLLNEDGGQKLNRDGCSIEGECAHFSIWKRGNVLLILRNLDTEFLMGGYHQFTYEVVGNSALVTATPAVCYWDTLLAFIATEQHL
ncbi:hypothetical protein A2U01_0007405 [Trifolium medium]|uniref:Uncharacterized protein n=1 Tax=Trifolium medium TaxID=97028 RepID=A0A392MGD7_9FABA|nr:hypothetical protein [Trifolium medium]